MKSCIKKISGIIFILILVLGFVSCKPEVVVTDTTAPGCVTNVNAESEEGKIVLTWTDPSDADLLGIKIYNGTEVQARAASFSDGLLVGKGIQKYEVTNLEDGKKYSFRISAVDNALNESEKVIIAALKFSAKVISVTKYVCPKDKKEFATAEEAANCCGVQTVEKEVAVYKYVCPKDKKEFATAQEAADCCGVQIEYVDKEVEKIVKKYVCPRDGKEYDTAEEAESCCGPVVNTVIKYVCPKDKKEFATAEEAANCCGVQTVEKEVTVYKYVCPKDKKEFSTAQEAADCCGVQIEYVDKEVEKIVKKYVCPRDGKEYDTAEAAEECCGPVVNTVIKYVCPKDKKEFATAEEAANCCGVQTVENEVTVYKYVCPKDKKEYATAQEAADCCGVQIEYVDKEVEKIVKKYVCPRDGKEYDTAEAAEECCGPVVEEKLVYTTAVKAGSYTVYHLQQKTSGGKAFADYTLYTTENSKTVAENSTLENLKKTYAGFTAKALAQNESALYVFYDRNVITYTYLSGTEGKFDDGTTEKNIKGLYGASVSVPIVTSSTHNFGGWYTSDNTALGSIYGAEDLTFTVEWTPKVYWYETPVDAETGNAATAASKYIYFGVFPKTVLPENSAVTVDETVTVEMGANTYYKGNDGNWYAKVTENCNGYHVFTYSDGTTVKQKSAESTRYFKVEPIKWKVLTTDYNGTGRALLLAEDTLTANVPYYVSTSDRTIGGSTVYANNYKYSTIRAYLNGAYESNDTQTKTYEGKGFLQTAFTSSARFLIAETEVDNSAKTTGYSESTYANDYYCKNTSDKIFLLSESEVINSAYGFAADYSSRGQGNARIRVTTDYAMANQAHQSPIAGFGGSWWLRSPGYTSSGYARYVDSEGFAFYSYNVPDKKYGVVPALSISF